MNEQILPENIASFRRFGRFYTKQIGLLHRGLLKTRFPLPQANPWQYTLITAVMLLLVIAKVVPIAREAWSKSRNLNDFVRGH